MKKKILGLVIVAALLAAGVCFYIVWTAKKAAADATDAYNAAVQEYNDAIDPFNEAVKGISDENKELQDALDAAQAVLDKGKKAYEPDTRKKLEKAVQKAGKVFEEVPALIDSFELREVPATLNKKELDLAEHEAETALDAVKEAMEKIPDTPKVPDFSNEIEAVKAAQKNYEDSIQMLANITAPPDSFVKERLERIETVVQAAAVTADYDPNGLLGKKDGYIGCVYFLDERIDRSRLPSEDFAKEPEAAASGGTAAEAASAMQSAEAEAAASGGTAEAAATAVQSAEEEAAASGGTAEAAAAAEVNEPESSLEVVRIGTAGGGSVEIFATAEEAEKRAEYLAFFDGSVMDAGSCAIEGTCLIRTSKYLNEEEQEALTGAIREALLSVED